MTFAVERAVAPGCYGSALTYKEEASECRSCPLRAECAPISAQRLDALRQRLGLEPVRRSVSKAARPMEAAAPSKFEQLLERIRSVGADIQGDLLRGVNPFPRGPNFMQVAAELLLKLPEGVDRDFLRLALQRKLNQSDVTARANQTLAFRALVALDVASELDGKLTLKGKPC